MEGCNYEHKKHSQYFNYNSIYIIITLCGSVQFSCSVMSDSLQPRGLQNARLPCPSPTPWAYSNSCPSSQSICPSCPSCPSRQSICHPLLCSPSIFPSIRVFSSEKFFASGGQRIGVSASASVVPVKIQN